MISEVDSINGDSDSPIDINGELEDSNTFCEKKEPSVVNELDSINGDFDSPIHIMAELDDSNTHCEKEPLVDNELDSSPNHVILTTIC